MDKQTKRFYEFGPFRLDLAQRILLRNGQHIPLTLKAFETLCVLVKNSGRILEKEELLNQIWPDTFIEETTLAKNISTLRKVLADGDSTKEYIETIPRRGYRFVAEVNEAGAEETTLILQEHTHLRIIAEEVEIPAGPAPLVSMPEVTERGRKQWRVSWMGIVVSVVLLLGVVTAAFYWQSAKQEQAPSTTKIKTLAVLPFKFVGVKEEDAYLGVGLTDALITKLVNLRQVVVRPTSAILKYGAEGRDALAAGRELQVEAVLDGRVQKYGEQIRISLQLVRVADGAALWGGEFSGREADILTLQEAMGERVARSLVEHLSSEEWQLLAKRCTENAEACHAYLKGRYFWNTAGGMGEKAIKYFEQAIEKDPRYAPAYASLTDCYYTLGTIEGDSGLKQKARAAGVRALEIDETLAEAHSALAFIKLMEDWDWAGAERAAKRAIELNPNQAAVQEFYGWMLALMGRTTESLVELKRAQELDPISLRIKKSLAVTLYFAGQYEQAIEHCQRILEMEPDHPVTHSVLGMIYAEQGRYEAAVAELQRVKSQTGFPAEIIAYLGYVYAKWGKRTEALRHLDELKRDRQRNQDNAFLFAVIHIGLDEKEQALAYLEQGYEKRDTTVLAGLYSPPCNSLRSDSRFQDLLRRMGLEP